MALDSHQNFKILRTHSEAAWIRGRCTGELQKLQAHAALARPPPARPRASLEAS